MPLIGSIADHPPDLVKYSVRGLRDIVLCGFTVKQH